MRRNTWEDLVIIHSYLFAGWSSSGIDGCVTHLYFMLLWRLCSSQFNVLKQIIFSKRRNTYLFYNDPRIISQFLLYKYAILIRGVL
jgi:hypothetical protein